MSRPKRQRMIVAMVATKPRETLPPEFEEVEADAITAEEFFEMPESVNKRELVNGEVVEMSPDGGPHGRLQMRLGRFSSHTSRRNAQGEIFGDLGFVLSRNPDKVRAPDVSFVSASQLREHPMREGYYEGYPDLAVEVASPNDRLRDVEEKVQEYFDAGTRLVWLVYPVLRVVTVRYPDGRGQTLRGDDVLSGEDVLFGFEVKLTDLFGKSPHQERTCLAEMTGAEKVN